MQKEMKLPARLQYGCSLDHFPPASHFKTSLPKGSILKPLSQVWTAVAPLLRPFCFTFPCVGSDRTPHCLYVPKTNSFSYMVMKILNYVEAMLDIKNNWNVMYRLFADKLPMSICQEDIISERHRCMLYSHLHSTQRLAHLPFDNHHSHHNQHMVYTSKQLYNIEIEFLSEFPWFKEFIIS